jgi:hypothetical protein
LKTKFVSLKMLVELMKFALMWNKIPFRSHNFLDVESVHCQQCDSDFLVASNEVYLQVVEQ